MSSERVEDLVALVVRNGGRMPRRRAAMRMGVSTASLDRYVRAAVDAGRIRRERVRGQTVLVVVEGGP